MGIVVGEIYIERNISLFVGCGEMPTDRSKSGFNGGGVGTSYWGGGSGGGCTHIGKINSEIAGFEGRLNDLLLVAGGGGGAGGGNYTCIGGYGGGLTGGGTQSYGAGDTTGGTQTSARCRWNILAEEQLEGLA